MIDTMIRVTTKMPPMDATSATVSLLMYCFARGRAVGCRYQAAAAATTQATMASTSRVKPRTAARRAEIRTIPITTRSRTEKGMGRAYAGEQEWSRLCGFEAWLYSVKKGFRHPREVERHGKATFAASRSVPAQATSTIS